MPSLSHCVLCDAHAGGCDTACTLDVHDKKVPVCCGVPTNTGDEDWAAALDEFDTSLDASAAAAAVEAPSKEEQELAAARAMVGHVVADASDCLLLCDCVDNGLKSCLCDFACSQVFFRQLFVRQTNVVPLCMRFLNTSHAMLCRAALCHAGLHCRLATKRMHQSLMARVWWCLRCRLRNQTGVYVVRTEQPGTLGKPFWLVIDIINSALGMSAGANVECLWSA